MSEQHVDEFRSLTISSRVLVLLNVECLTKLFLSNNGLVPLFDMEELNGHSKIFIFFFQQENAKRCKNVGGLVSFSAVLNEA